jgi:hypothetical protein
MGGDGAFSAEHHHPRSAGLIEFDRRKRVAQGRSLSL